MKYEELIKEVKTAAFEAIRLDTEKYFEAVIVNAQLTSLTSTLDKLLGSAVCPSKTPLTPQMKDAVKEFGGIMPDQTLYFFSQAGETILVMFWPWRDGVHTTVKIALSK